MGPSLVPEPSLSAEERQALEKGIAEFNAGLFFECHDTLEELWSGVRGPSRNFFQGLIQVAVGLYHLGNGNRVGAARLFDRARRRLEDYPPHYGGVDLGALRQDVVGWRRDLTRTTRSREDLARESLPRPRLVCTPASGDAASEGGSPGRTR